MTPVNARLPESKEEEPAPKPITDKLTPWKKTAGMPQKPKAEDPTDLPLSERFAGWEQRVSQTPTSERGVASKVVPTPKGMCTPLAGVVQDTGMVRGQIFSFKFLLSLELGQILIHL